MARHINDSGLYIIKKFEGLELEPYMDDNDGWTIGYGHKYPKGSPKPENITQEQAEELLRKDLAWAEKAVFDTVPEWLNDNQFSALVSFVYNIGPVNFRSSTLLKKLVQGDVNGAAKEFGRWKYDDGKELPGLVKRRLAEKTLFKK